MEAAQRNGLTYVTIGHHYLYGDLRWLQPVPTLARLAAELDEHVTLARRSSRCRSTTRCSRRGAGDARHHDRGRLVVGMGAGYRYDEFTALGVDFTQRFAMLDESMAR